MKLAAKWTMKLEVGFGRCFVTMLIAHVVSGLLAFVIGLAAALRLRELGHAVPRQLGLGQLVPARQVQRLVGP